MHKIGHFPRRDKFGSCFGARWPTILLFPLLLGSVASGVEVDCRIAEDPNCPSWCHASAELNPAEARLCQDSSAAFTDVQVAMYFEAALKIAPSLIPTLRESQKAFVERRNRCLMQTSAEPKDSRCLLDVYAKREAELKAMIHQPAAERAKPSPTWVTFKNQTIGISISFPPDWKVLKDRTRISFDQRVSIDTKAGVATAEKCTASPKEREGAAPGKDEILGGKKFKSFVEVTQGMGHSGADIHDYLFENGRCVRVSYQLQSIDPCRAEALAKKITQCEINQLKEIQEDDWTIAVIQSIRFIRQQ